MPLKIATTMVFHRKAKPSKAKALARSFIFTTVLESVQAKPMMARSAISAGVQY